MKRIFFFMTTILSLVLTGCSADMPDIQPSGNDSMPRTLRTISPRAAKENVRALLASLPNHRPGSRTDGGGAAINDSILIIPGGDVVVVDDNIFNQVDFQDTAMVCAYAYAVNFTNNAGCIVVPAVEGLPSCLMYMENGNMTSEDINPTNPRPPTNFDFTLELMTSWIEMKLLEDPPYEGGGDTIAPEYTKWTCEKNLAGNGIPVNWGQNDPFNRQCPIIEGQRAPVGCVAVAVGQIMAFHRHPNHYGGHDYDWNQMLVSIEANGVAHLLADLGKSSNLDMNYGANSSGTSTKHAKRTFRNFGYSSCKKLDDFSYPKVIAEIDAGYPVLFRGKKLHQKNGHAWVVDGYSNWYRRRIRDNKLFKQEYVRCNWGWGGSCNGYVLAGIFDYENPILDPHPDGEEPVEVGLSNSNSNVPQNAYRKKIKIITGIRP